MSSAPGMVFTAACAVPQGPSARSHSGCPSHALAGRLQTRPALSAKTRPRRAAPSVAVCLSCSSFVANNAPLAGGRFDNENRHHIKTLGDVGDRIVASKAAGTNGPHADGKIAFARYGPHPPAHGTGRLASQAPLLHSAAEFLKADLAVAVAVHLPHQRPDLRVCDAGV